MPVPPKNLKEFQALVEIVKDLRGPQGCPWDKEQTHKSLAPFAIEEAFELAEALESNNKSDIIEELGDLLLQVALHSELGRQSGQFDIHDVCESINKKMVERHPHVFSDIKVSGIDEVWDNWSKIKEQEKIKKHLNTIVESAKNNAGDTLINNSTENQKILENPFSSIPTALPALQRASKIGVKTRKFRFDWNHVSQVLAKVDEELAEFKEVYEEIKKAQTVAKKNNVAKIDSASPHSAGEFLKSHDDLRKKAEHEIGDMLFSISQLARHLDLDAEQCLRECNNRFMQRFTEMQNLATIENKQLLDYSQDELEVLYKKAKVALENH
jgi:tetrapyrrole methylase family protein/MazG family protein